MLAGAFRRIAGEPQTMTDIPTVLPASEAARVLGLSPSTLAKLRLRGSGPIYCKLGRRVLYRPDDLSAWLAEHLRMSTSDPGGSCVVQAVRRSTTRRQKTEALNRFEAEQKQRRQQLAEGTRAAVALPGMGKIQ
jgi:hypothetical protein